MRLKELILPSSAIGIELILKSNEGFTMNIVVLKKKGNKITVEQKKEGLSTFEDLKTILDKKTPIIVSFTGKGIITKKIETNDLNADPSSHLNKVLPGANTKEFCIQVSSINEREVYVSVIRSSILEKAIKDFSKIGIENFSNFFLGPFALNNTFGQLGIPNGLNIANHQLHIENNVICNILPLQGQSKETDITIGKESISPELLIALGSAFNSFLEPAQGIQNSELLNGIKKEFSEKQRFEKIRFSSLIALFVILLINYFVFSSYWNKSNELNSVYAMNSSALQQLDTLKKELSFKTVFLENNGLLEGSKTSFYADILAKDLPASINWTSIKLNPQKKTKNAESGIFEFENKTIDITGKCSQSSELNFWMKEIKKQSWINNVTLLNYSQAKKNEAGLFLLRINIK